MTTKDPLLQAQAEAAFIEGAQRLAEQEGVEMRVNAETLQVEFNTTEEQELNFALKVAELYDVVHVRFYERGI